MSQSENMAAVTEDDNPGQLPVAGDEAPGAAAAGEVAGEAGGQDEVAQPGEPDAQAELDAQAGSADVINVTSPMSQDMLRLLYRNCDAVLAN